MCLVLHLFHIHHPSMWNTRRWVDSVIPMHVADIPVVQSIGIDVCILSNTLSISIVLYIASELLIDANVCCWYPYCLIHLNESLYLVLHHFNLHHLLQQITSEWVDEVVLMCIVDFTIVQSIGFDVCILLHPFHKHCPMLWITRLWVGSVMLSCIVDIFVVQKSVIDGWMCLVCILFISIILRCGILEGELTQLS